MRSAIDLSPPRADTRSAEPAPLVAHIIHQFSIGGLENGLVNLINHMPAGRYRHAIICLKGFSGFHNRLQRKDVEIVALNKKEGHDIGLYLRLFRTLRRLRPDIVHTRNLSALEGQFVAALAGIRARAHGEHGRDMVDLDGRNTKYRLLRKALRPFVGHFTTVSKDLEGWLAEAIGAPPHKIAQIYNGVDSARFYPRNTRVSIGPPGFMHADCIVVGSVGRMAAVKDFPSLVRAFLLLLERHPESRNRLRLLIAGDGEARTHCHEMLRAAGAEALAWLPGERDDIATLMQAMDVFALPSLAEGISNTILEAMSSGLPVIATRVGGNVELVEDGATGRLVPPGDSAALAAAIYQYCNDDALRRRHGTAARHKIEMRFSMDSMTQAYMDVYDRLLNRAPRFGRY